MLPRISGLDVLRRMRAARIRTQTILLTARDSMKDIVDGLDAGADDYITKPFALDVLLARVRAAARRVPEKSMPVIQYMDLSLNPKTLEMQRGGRVETLTRTEYALLETLVQRAEHVVQRNVLIDEGWGQNSDVSFDSLYVFIRSLRKKITHAGEKQLLHTIRGVGYCLKGKP
jgi:two-component system response regulator MprA